MIPFSISIDGTKLSNNISLSSAHKCIFGYASPHRAISIENKSIEEVVLLLKGKGMDMVHTEEVKVVLVTFQQVTNGMCSYMNLCGRPQTSNESSTFNDDTIRSDLEYRREENNAALTKVAVDGVSCDDYFTRTLSYNFLKDKSSHTAITDPHHNFNNFWYQLIGGSGCTVIRIYIINTHLLIIARVSINLWRIIDYESDLLVLKLSSYDTLCKLCEIFLTEEEGSVGALCVTLYFVRLSLYATNSK